MFTGTIVNVAAIVVGGTLGAVAGGRIPERFRATIMGALGLIVLGLGVRESLAAENYVVVLAAVLLGALVGELVRIEQGLTRLGNWLQTRLVGSVASIDVEMPEDTPLPVRPSHRFAEGFVVASLVYLIGPLTILGSIKDGLGTPDDLLVKAGLDGFASIAFAAVYGWGVVLTAVPVLLVQGGIALGAGALQGSLSDGMIAGLEAAGGVLLLGLALRLLDLKRLRVANMLPALVFAPLLVALFLE